MNKQSPTVNRKEVGVCSPWPPWRLGAVAIPCRVVSLLSVPFVSVRGLRWMLCSFFILSVCSFSLAFSIPFCSSLFMSIGVVLWFGAPDNDPRRWNGSKVVLPMGAHIEMQTV